MSCYQDDEDESYSDEDDSYSEEAVLPVKRSRPSRQEGRSSNQNVRLLSTSKRKVSESSSNSSCRNSNLNSFDEDDNLSPYPMESENHISKHYANCVCVNKDERTNNKVDWRNLTFIPQSEEINGTLIERAPYLRPVKVGELYQSRNEYMDTYYRLLRADCYSSIQNQIKEFCSGKLQNDMNVYRNVSLVGSAYDRINSTFNLALTFISKCQNRKILKFGSLLCLSPSGNFLDDLIWATVTEHSSQLLIVVQLCTESNDRSDCDNMITLWESDGNTIMIESASYYNSFRPVLQSLRNIDLDNFPLCDEIIKGHKSAPLANEYIPGDCVLDADVLYPQRKGKIKLKKLLELLENETSILDSSQAEAIKYSLSNRLAVIQGPPGCGKTVIGTKLAEIILSCDVGTVTPILVLTSKNHCLDEFLKRTLQFVQKDDIVRIGGRSKEVELEECNLNQLLKKRSYKLVHQIEKKIEIIHSESDIFYSCTQITPESLLMELKETQLWLLKDAHLRCKDNLRSDVSLNSAIIKLYMTLENFFRIKPETLKNNSKEDEFRKHSIAIIKKWWPNTKNLKTIKENRFAFHSITPNSIESQLTEAQIENDEVLREATQEYQLSMHESFVEEQNFEKITVRNWNKSKSENKFLIELKNLPDDKNSSLSLLNEDNIWLFNEMTKLKFLRSLMKTKLDHHKCRLTELLKQLEVLRMKKKEEEVLEKLKIVENKLIVGITITGASIHHALIQKLSPEVVIVEEAAEILEPNLLAALNPGIKHLILIGDHKQLPPNVGTFELCKTYSFNKSMMERLISNNYLFKSLNSQSRMRPEFAELLKEIYPDLRNNEDIVSLNKPLACMEKSMFFWCHSNPETKGGKSSSNTEEITRILYLTLFLIDSGCEPMDITVLCAYQGQILLLKREMTKFRECDDVVISTIDNYQGDENKYLIVSLVRSNNDQHPIGFLNNFNRRCVAQSRAKCGLYFVGDENTFLRSKYWEKLIITMREKGCVGYELGIQCQKHLSTSRKYVRDGDDLKQILKKSRLICDLPCGDKMPCKVYACKQPCKSNHSHDKCLELVKFRFQSCGHSGKREYHQKEEDVPCLSLCSSKMDCGRHSCNYRCSDQHNHSICEVLDDYSFPLCKHKPPNKKKCCEPINQLCLKENIVKGQCNHEILRACFGDVSECFEVCLRKRPCNHLCTAHCSDVCESKVCESCLCSFKTTMLRMRVEAEKNVASMNDRNKNVFNIQEIFNTGKSSLDYQNVCDLVKNFLRAGSDWYPTITKVEKINNLQLLRDFEKTKSTMLTIFTDNLFTLTDDEHALNTAKNGFTLTKTHHSIHGIGIQSFAKRVNFINQMYIKYCTKVLLCKVLLGKVWKKDQPNPTLTLKTIRQHGYDSVLVTAKPSTADQTNDDFIIYDSKQAYPDYIITFENTPVVCQPPYTLDKPANPPNSNGSTTSVSDSRNYEFVQSIFYHRLALKGINFDRFEIKCIKVVQNAIVEEAFKQKRKEFIKSCVSADTLMAFLGSNFSEQIDELIFNQQQFMHQNKSVNFFQIPDIRPGDKTLLLCQLVLGNQYQISSPTFNSSPTLIMKHWNQIWPRYLIYLL